eukprot:TRINITY_DN3147_c0_g1_i1.p1 TRINITY_DN3147_c0_g1~~TRINITY_DN3147_c0_g1_i1.p1  ORF type:complete len:118 (-),score=14.90 TRINITY_DN3147_c0_g1_i1:86-439(-)
MAPAIVDTLKPYIGVIGAGLIWLFDIIIASIAWWKGPSGSMKLCRVGDVGPKDFKNASPSVYGLCVWTKVACILMALIATCMLIVYIVGVIPGIFKKFKFITPFRLYFSGFLMSACK